MMVLNKSGWLYLMLRGRAYACILCSLYIFVFCPYASANEIASVVLVTHKSSELGSLTLLEIRRLYLGFPVSNEHVKRPVINRSNNEVYEAMHMTEDGYRRKIVRRVFRYGTNYIDELYSLEGIRKHLAERPGDVVFIDARKLPLVPDARVIVRLW